MGEAVSARGAPEVLSFSRFQDQTMFRAVVFALGVAGAFGLVCNEYTRMTGATADAAANANNCTTGFDTCMTFSYSVTESGATVETAMAMCVSMTCDAAKEAQTSDSGIDDWACETCTEDECNCIKTLGESCPGVGSADAGSMVAPTLLSVAVALAMAVLP